MLADNERDRSIQEIDTAVERWSQGDFVLTEQWFVLRFNPDRPLTESSQNAANDESDSDLVEEAVSGLVVVTQTCDIVRSCASRPFVEVVPLVAVVAEEMNEIQRGRRPQYAYLAGAAAHNLVADLDRVMTVEKAVLADWERKQGCHNDPEIRLFAQALARKRVRFAFPDDFNRLAGKLQDRLKDKHDKSSPEGDSLRVLQEIRVRAAPSWNDDKVELMFWFIRSSGETQFKGEGWDKQLENWLKLIPASGRFSSIEGAVVTLEDLTAKDYVESDRLDLDHLSQSSQQ